MGATLTTGSDRAHHIHLCWVYDEVTEFHAQVGEFLADGLRRGERVWYVGDDDVERLARDLCADAGMADALDGGAARVASVGDVYPTDTVIDPAAQLEIFAAATDEALAAGFTGLRIAVDATTLVGTRSQQDAFGRYEHLLDRYSARHPLSALCAYDRTGLDHRVLGQISCLHPLANEHAAPFRLHASAADDYSAVLSGELDVSSIELFPGALRHTDPPPRRGSVILDAVELTFVDHHALLTLADHADRRAVPVVLRTSLPTPTRIINALNLTGVHVEVPA